MRKFFIYLALLLGITLALSFGLAAVLDVAYQRVRTGQTGGKINDYLHKEPQPELLIMGDSRALYQILPDSFHRPTYNLSHAGMYQIFQTGLLSVITQSRKPQVILLQVAPFEYIGPIETTTSAQNLKYYYGRNDTVTRYINSISRYERYKYVYDLYRYNGRVLPLVKNLVDTYRKSDYGNGYIELPPTPRDSLNTVFSAVADSNSRAARFHYPRLRYLQSFIQLCKQNNTKLICFTSPVYRRSTQAIHGTAVLDSFLRANNVPYVDYIGRPLPELQRRGVYWKDARHLNLLGGSIQSQHLAAEVRRFLGGQPAADTVALAAQARN
jgi:hypothetical protein